MAQQVKNPPAVQEMLETWVQSLGQEDPLEKVMAILSVFLLGRSHGQRSLVGYGPWGHKESDITGVTEYSVIERKGFVFKWKEIGIFQYQLYTQLCLFPPFHVYLHYHLSENMAFYDLVKQPIERLSHIDRIIFDLFSFSISSSTTWKTLECVYIYNFMYFLIVKSRPFAILKTLLILKWKLLVCAHMIHFYTKFWMIKSINLNINNPYNTDIWHSY